MTELVKRERNINLDERKPPLTSKDILLLLLYAPGQSKKNNEGIDGKLRFAKMVFLLKEETSIQSSVKEFYSDFAPRDYGPYSSDFDSDLQELKTNGLIEEAETEASAMLETTVKRADYRLTEKGFEYCHSLVRRVEKHILEEIAAIKKKFNGMKVETLVNYVYWKYPDYTTASKIRKEVY